MAENADSTTVCALLCYCLRKREVVKHILVSSVNRRTADTVVCVALKKVSPCSCNIGSGIFAAKCIGIGGHGLSKVDKIVLNVIVKKLNLDSGRMSCAKKSVEVVILHSGITKLALMLCSLIILLRADGIHILVHCGLTDLNVRIDLVHILNKLGKVTIGLVIILHVKSEDVVTNLIGLCLVKKVVERRLMNLLIMDIVVILVKNGECLLVGLHIRHVSGKMSRIIGVGKILQTLTKHGRTVNVEEPVGSGNLVKGTKGGNAASIGCLPVKEGGKHVLVSTTVEDSVLNTEATVKLRKLRGLTVRGRCVTRLHTSAKLSSHLVTEKKVSDKSLGRNGISLRKSVPVYDSKSLILDKLLYSLTILGTNGEVVLENDGTAVNTEGLVFRLVFEQIKDVIHKVSQTQLALLCSMTPFAVPMSTAYQVNDALIHYGDLL